MVKVTGLSFGMVPLPEAGEEACKAVVHPATIKHRIRPGPNVHDRRPTRKVATHNLMAYLPHCHGLTRGPMRIERFPAGGTVHRRKALAGYVPPSYHGAGTVSACDTLRAILV